MMILIKPRECLQDEKVQITVQKLQPYQRVTVCCRMKDSREKGYFSYAHYIANKYGNIDLSKDSSFGGHYTGIFQMGLISALVPEPNEYQFLRLFKKDVSKPNKITFYVYDNHLSDSELFEKEVKPLSSEVHYRHFMAPDVKRIPIKIGSVRGTLFIPPGKGPFPGVIDLFGTAGGCLEFRSAQLASRGIVSLALAYFAYDDLPQSPTFYDISYFKEAVQILLSYEQVSKPGVGVVGVSKGGDLALSMAVYIPEVTLAICINGCNANFSYPLKINDDETLPPLMHDMSGLKILPNRTVVTFDLHHVPEDYPETIIPLERSDAVIMFVVGEKDININSKECAFQATKRMLKHGKTNFKVLSYKEAGHLIEPPYSAFCSASYHKHFDFVLNWGGSLKGHSDAQEHSWYRMLEFIKEHLQNQIKAKL